MRRITPKRGFTLIELLVVIALIAILATVVILTLNPGELLRQTRDSSRISDMATLRSAIGIYLTEANSGSLDPAAVCHTTVSSTVFWTPDNAGDWNVTNSCGDWFATASTTATSSIAQAQATDGTGWIPINFDAIAEGSPIAVEPIDPINVPGDGISPAQGAFFYSYIPGGTTFKLEAFMESQKYTANGPSDIESTDGGINNYAYESGTNLQL